MKASWQTTGIGMVLSLLIGMGGSLAWSAKKKEQPEFQAPLVTQPRSQLSALGTIAPRGRIRHVAAPSSFSRIGRLLAEEGEHVTQGQVLAYSDDHKLRASELRQAEAQVAIAQSKLDQLIAGPDPHEVQALAVALSSTRESQQQKKRELERATGLVKSNSISQEEFEDKKYRVVLATFAVQELEAKYLLLKSQNSPPPSTASSCGFMAARGNVPEKRAFLNWATRARCRSSLKSMRRMLTG
jgi:HlyD family secretion protein